MEVVQCILMDKLMVSCVVVSLIECGIFECYIDVDDWWCVLMCLIEEGEVIYVVVILCVFDNE